MGMGSRIVRSIVALAVIGCASSATRARAQPSPTPTSAFTMLGPPHVTWIFAQGDANGARGDTLGPSSIIFEPIRLALQGSSVPGGHADPGCRDNNESTGSATASGPGYPMQHAAALQLVPKLTLVGFSRGGCQLDAGIGGALVYATPIRKDIWFVASAGIFHLPHAGPGGAPATKLDARVDLVLARPQGRSYAVGVGTRGVTFGGTL